MGARTGRWVLYVAGGLLAGWAVLLGEAGMQGVLTVR